MIWCSDFLQEAVAQDSLTLVFYRMLHPVKVAMPNTSTMHPHCCLDCGDKEQDIISR